MCRYDDCPVKPPSTALLQDSSLLQVGPCFPAPMGTTEATLRMENVDVKEEWQDETLPRYSSLGVRVRRGRSGPDAAPRCEAEAPQLIGPSA